MHEVLDLLKAAHIKVSFTLSHLFEVKFLPSEGIPFDSSVHAVLASEMKVISNMQVTFFVISSYVQREGGRQV
jgi:hypothetical protein